MLLLEFNYFIVTIIVYKVACALEGNNSSRYVIMNKKRKEKRMTHEKEINLWYILNLQILHYTQGMHKLHCIRNTNCTSCIYLYILDSSVSGIGQVGSTPRSQYLQKRRLQFKIGSRGSEPGCFTWPRGIAVGPDNSIVVADSSNHRVQVNSRISNDHYQESTTEFL